MLSNLQTLSQTKNALIRQHEIIANNLANLGTVGFKKDTVAFHEILDEKSNSTLVPVVKTDASNGDFQKTDNSLDLSLQGEGFFSVQTPQGVRYTRSGSFQLSDAGTVVDHFGNPVLSDHGPITIPADLRGNDVSVSTEGRMTIGETDLGKLRIENFKEGTSMAKVGQNLLEANNAEVAPGHYEILQGSIEMSTVNSAQEMVEMMDTLRLFETAQQATKMQDEALGKAISELA